MATAELQTIEGFPALRQPARRLARWTTVLDIDTSRRRTVELTDAVRRFCAGRDDGLCSIFVPHATAGVAIIETGAGSDDYLPD